MYKLVLLRHGESVWNKENRFTGWIDVGLSEKGTEEARRPGGYWPVRVLVLTRPIPACSKGHQDPVAGLGRDGPDVAAGAP